MGCICSTPRVVIPQTGSNRKGLAAIQQLGSNLKISAKKLKRPGRRESSEGQDDKVIPVQDVLEISKRIVEGNFNGLISPLVLASICLIESGGSVNMTKWEEHLNESRHGLCQMLFSTAQFLYASGYRRYQVSKPKALHCPEIALYFGAAYLKYLSEFNGEKQGERFVVCAYCGVDEEAAEESWSKYLRARQQLENLEEMIRRGEEEGDEPTIHVVQSGETLPLISRICGTTVEEILDANPDVKDADLIRAGDCIEIPVKVLLPRLYAARPSDTMASIARRHDISLFRLLRANPEIKNPNHLKPGWVLSIPGLMGTPLDGREHCGRGDLISAGVESGPFFLAAMAERYGLAIEDNFFGGNGGVGILSREEIRDRLRATRTMPLLRTPARKSSG
ncbi:hypothetical protein BSKO_11376 [Bryopsis sp. KO-2023]|nr:hypothetical protein BSKO_11376 [Bryopsis sp. KO-2023]